MPSMTSVESAISFLSWRAVSTERAISGLEVSLESLGLLALYSKYFPDEFAKLDLRWSDSQRVLRTCEDFIHKVDSELFPCQCPMDSWDSDEGPELELILIGAPWPAWYEGFDVPPLAEVILRATGEMNPDGSHDFRPEKYLDRKAIEKLCFARRAPLAHLPTAIRFVEKTTGNSWCDVTDEEICSGGLPNWSEENMDWLSQQWKEALAIHGKFRHLEDWMGKDPKRIQTIESLIKRAMKPMSKSRVQVSTSGRPLVEILGEEEFDDDIEQ